MYTLPRLKRYMKWFVMNDIISHLMKWGRWVRTQRMNPLIETCPRAAHNPWPGRAQHRLGVGEWGTPTEILWKNNHTNPSTQFCVF